MAQHDTATTPSADGTSIAFQRSGRGPALVFVDGAFCTRSMGPGKTLAPALEDRFTTYIYDRRGRGQSGDAEVYQPVREVEDLASVIDAAGGTAYVFGHSSGAVLALEAARAGLPIAGLVLYEPPVVVDGARPPVPADLPQRVARLAKAGKGRAVVRTFMTEAVRAPKPVALAMSLMPGGGKLSASAHTVAYDAAIMNAYQQGTALPAELGSALRLPTLVIAGSKSPRWLRNGCEAVAAAVPGAGLRLLEGQSHTVVAAVTAPVVQAFLAGVIPAEPERARP